MKIVSENRKSQSETDLPKTKNISGQTIIEVLVALSLIVFGIIGIFRLMSQSLRLTSTVRDQYVANYLAAEGVEITKNIIDTNVSKGDSWNMGLTTDGASYEADYLDTVQTIQAAQDRFLRFDPVSGFYGYDLTSPDQTRFKRTITISYPDCPGSSCDHMQVNSIVKWLGRGSARFDTDIEDHFFNWNQ